MTLFRLCTIAIAAAMVCVSQSAIADADESRGPRGIINFQELSTGFIPCPTCDPTADLAGVGPTYSSLGYTFFYTPAPGEPYPVGFSVVGPFWPWNDGTNALVANSDNALTTLKRDDGRPFALAAIDLAELNGPRSDLPTVIVFQGTTASGELVSRKITLDNKTGFQRFHFSSEFRDLLSVQWQQGDNVTNNPHMFDNVVVFTTEFHPGQD